MDNRSLGGSCEDVLRDLKTVEAMASDLRLQLNKSKPEVVCRDSSTLSQYLASSLGFCVTSTDSVWFLGSPLSETLDEAILEKVKALKVLESRITYLQIQDAILLLRYSLAMPRFWYLLRTAPCFQSPQLARFDETLCQILSSVCNIFFTSENRLWRQASLRVKFGGLGIQSAVHLAPSAYLASLAGSSELVHRIVQSSSVPYSK